MPTSAPEWEPMDEPPPKPGRYMVRTVTDYWFIATYDGSAWKVDTDDVLELSGWREIK